ncbi:MAG: hypothetical protein ABSC08_02830 [Bryobacteraceae bacterium]|jgi:hypothetical protein
MPADQETRAIWRLIQEVDSIDAWRDRTGRRIVVLFLATFAVAAGLLVWAATHAQTIVAPPGPRVHAVLHSAKEPAR